MGGGNTAAGQETARAHSCINWVTGKSLTQQLGLRITHLLLLLLSGLAPSELSSSCPCPKREGCQTPADSTSGKQKRCVQSAQASWRRRSTTGAHCSQSSNFAVLTWPWSLFMRLTVGSAGCACFKISTTRRLQQGPTTETFQGSELGKPLWGRPVLQIGSRKAEQCLWPRTDGTETKPAEELWPIALIGC